MNTKSNFLKSIFISLILLAGTASAWADGGIYLKPNDNWEQANARFAAYFFKSSNSDSQWMSMYASNQSDYYVCAIPDGYDKVILCRMNPANNNNNWDNKWNQTGDLNVPSDEKIVCSINSGQWDCGTNVTWSAINWYIVGDFNEWNTTANKMPCDISIESGNHTMKIVSEYGEWFGNTGTMIRGNSSGWTMTYGEDSNCTLTADVAGTYNFSCTGTKLTITYPEECFLKGDFNDWSNTHSILGGSVTINLKAGTYEFKIQRYDATSAYWVSNNGTMTRDNCSDWTMYDNVDKNCKITADFDGDYTFTYDRSTGKLSVTYPTAYKVTYGVGTNKGTASVTTSPNITSGSLALPSTSITFSKGATKEGYTWKGWYSNATGTGTNFGNGTTYTSTNRTGDISIYACYNLITYKITYNLNGGSGDSNTTYNVESAAITLPTPTKTGYTFEGWYTASDFSGSKVTQIANGSTGDKTFYAKWTANKYTVRFHENGGTGSMADQEFTYDVEQVLTGNAFTLENALFVGWATSEENAKNGTVTYTDGQSVSNLTTTKDGVVNLYAVWATISITSHPEYIRTLDRLTLNISYTNIPQNWRYVVKIEAGIYNNSGVGQYTSITNGTGSSTYTAATQIPVKTNTVVVGLYANGDDLAREPRLSASVTVICESTHEIGVFAYTEGVNSTTGGTVNKNSIQPSTNVPEEVVATPKTGYMFDQWFVINDNANITIENPHSPTTNVTATGGGQIYANFKKLPLKTIYLKTVEGTTDGVTWFVVYGGQEHEMTSLGCTGEYYRGEVPEGTSFQFVSRDASTNIVETKGTDLQYVEGKTLYNLVSAAASGNKIFFKPNQQWIDKAAKEKWHFAGSFWTDSAVWKEMTDDNSDGIYECEKPANAIQVIFCLVYTTNDIENWGNVWSYRKIQTDGDNAYKKIPNGSNLFTITDNKEDQAIGTWSTHADTPVNGEGEWTTFTGITYRITFDQQDATTAGTSHVDVAYHASMPEIEKLPTKTEKKFGGYYTQQNGQGVMLVNAFGEWQDANGYISSTTWEREGCVTLYAYWKDLTPEITDVTLNTDIFEPVDENNEGFVTAKPIINEHNNTTLTYVVCWKLLYTNGREVEGHKASTEGCEQNQVKFSIAGLSTGTYTIRASLHTGNDCGSGEEISRFDKQFSIVANRIITVNYTCDGNTIMASTKQHAHVINETEITAPNIVGYTFKEWVAGDGVVISSTNANSVTFTAYYDGNLTATYTKNQNIIYFYNTLGWQNVYVYFYSSDKYWDYYMGSGSKYDKTFTNGDDHDHKPHYREYRGTMTHIAGTQIWYYDCSVHGDEIKGYTNVVFNKYQQDNYEWFHNTEVVRRGDMDADKLPMYVPIKAAEETKNGTKYYNKGYWMNYPENTGYKLQIYDGTSAGAKEVASVRFPYSTNTIMPLTVSVDLEAGKTYGFKILREDNAYFSNSGTMTANSNGWSFTNDVNPNCGLKTTLAGDYTFTLKYAAPDQQDPNNYQYCVDVVYPVSVGDYRVVYTDNAQWSQTAAHGAKWYHPSYAIKKNSSATEVKTDIVSFFIAKNNSPAMKFQKCTAINGQTVTWADVANGTITIPNDVVSAAGVYNFIVKQPAGGASISVESVEPYTGNYYIRVDAMDGKWGNYKTNPDNRMTYSAFSESEANKFGERFSHYATKWCEEGTNVKFTIANDYSPCISDTLIQDNGNPFKNIDIHGNLTSNSGKHAANIRFMWNRHTNKISRAYVAGSTFTDRQFLILKADKEIKNSSGGSLSNAGDNHNAHQAIFSDTQNWIYERTIQVQPGTRVKLYACYPEANVANAQYFRGTYDNNNATWNDNNSVQILGGNGSSWNTIRIIYDFKTNRLMAAWVPTGEINDVKSLEADMMILREHQEDAACITFADSDDKLVNIKTVYGVLRLNKYILNNKKTTGNHEILDPKDQKSIYERALYFISFPFDVHLSDVFGFGTYGTHWVISEYNGLRRATNGYFIDNCMNEDCTNWDYIWDPSNFKMQANQGYLLSLDLDLMKDNNESFWANGINTVELYFPSYEHVQTIQQTSYTMPALSEEDYKCKHKGHEVIDSYWRCIGVPSFADYNSALTDGTNEITWQPKGSEFPFLYEWNVSDNSLMVQATSTYRFRPTYAYLVQNGNQIHWSAVNATPNQPSNIVARRQAPGEINNYEWKLTLSRNEQIEDQAFVRLSDDEQVTTEFDFNQDLSKEFNYGRSDIYTLIGYEKAAANSLPFSEQTTLIPLGLSIEYNGDYTIAMPGRMENIGVTLIDTESNTRTNLSAGMEYTLTLNKGDYNNRFFIEISPIPQTPTDIEYVTGDSNSQNSVRKVLIDNILYIVRDGQIFDARGARVK